MHDSYPFYLDLKVVIDFQFSISDEAVERGHEAVSVSPDNHGRVVQQTEQVLGIGVDQPVQRGKLRYFAVRKRVKVLKLF